MLQRKRKKMKRATLDVGTNSVRLLIADYCEGAFYNAEKHVDITRLGKGVNETQMLDLERIEDTARAVKAYKEMAEKSGCKDIAIMATSAARDAKNKSVLQNQIKQKSGLDLDIISGELEAQIGFKGVMKGVAFPEKTHLVIDIGGGSTELIIGNVSEMVYANSLDMGAVRLTGACVKHDPIDISEVHQIKSRALELLETCYSDLASYEIESVVGIGGTAATYITMIHEIEVYTREKVHGQSISLDQIKAMNQKLISLDNVARKNCVGLEPKRADIILAGGLILEIIMEKMKLNTLSFSDYDNLEGYMAYLDENR